MKKTKIENKLLLTCVAILALAFVCGNSYAQSSGVLSDTVTCYTSADGWWKQADIPTLTEWGLIIFGVMLLGFISWVFLRKKQVIGVRS